MKALQELARAGNARHADFLGLDVPDWLAKWLLRQIRNTGDGSTSEGTVIALHASQGKLAAELGATRSTLNRALNSVESLGLIEVEGNWVTLVKPDWLVSYTW